MSDARIGSEIAGYRIVSLRGQGGMGTVYVAEQTSPRRKVVLGPGCRLVLLARAK